MINEFLSKSLQFGTYDVSVQEALEVILAVFAARFFIYVTKKTLGKFAKNRRLDEGRRFLIFRLARTLIYIITIFIVTDILALTSLYFGQVPLLYWWVWV